MRASQPQDGTLYRAIWRWHFLAGIVVAPFAIFLAITGAIYLWKPQYENWRYRDFFQVDQPSGKTALASDVLFETARRAYPNLSPVQYLPPAQPTASAEVQFGSARGSEKRSVFLNPYSGALLGEIEESKRFMTLIHDLHGTLLAGTAGQILIELVASWALVLLVTGLYLWWPRPFTVRGFLLPRFGQGRRALLRDIHAVPAVWMSPVILCLLATGIQWTKVGGAWTRTVGQALGQWTPRETSASVHRSELLGGWSPPLADRRQAQAVETVSSTPPGDDPHAEHRKSASEWSPDTRRVSLERVVSIAREQNVSDAYAIALPRGPTGVYSILSDRNRALTRTYIHLDQYTGRILAAVHFNDFGVVGKFYTLGIIAHEGQLFGLLNQLIGLLACLTVIVLAATGLAMWWSRRPAGGQQSRPTLRTVQSSKAVLIVALVLSFIVPLVGASLIIIALSEGLITMINRNKGTPERLTT